MILINFCMIFVVFVFGVFVSIGFSLLNSVLNVFVLFCDVYVFLSCLIVSFLFLIVVVVEFFVVVVVLFFVLFVKMMV